MNIAFYNAVTAMDAYQTKLDVVSNNIANINTVGYKASTTSFQDLLFNRMDINNEEPELIGRGVKVNDIQLLAGQGIPVPTDQPLDFCISGSGFFAVERGEDGEIQYTRNGTFGVSMEGGTGYLVTSDGGYVLDSNGSRIRMEYREIETGGKDGGTTETHQFDYDKAAEEIGVYGFANPYALEPVGSGSFVPNEKSGEAEDLTGGSESERPYTLLQKYVESSGAHLATEMVEVILAQRAFQLNSRMVQTADQLDEIVNNLR